MNEQTNKVAIVTGASRGIGAAVAQRLARDGFTVVVNYSGAAPEAEALVRSIEQAGGHALAAQADVADPAAVRRVFDAAQTAFGGVDVLVNNAGIMSLATIADSDDASVDRLIAVNLKGSFNTMREAALRLRDGGRIINFSSSVVGLLQPTYAVYAATKAAVEAMTGVLAKELRGRHITVNAIAPGPTATDLFLKGKSPELVDRLAKLAPLERLGQPTTSPMRWPFWPAPTAAGSTARCCAQTAESSERRLRQTSRPFRRHCALAPALPAKAPAKHSPATFLYDGRLRFATRCVRLRQKRPIRAWQRAVSSKTHDAATLEKRIRTQPQTGDAISDATTHANRSRRSAARARRRAARGRSAHSASASRTGC